MNKLKKFWKWWIVTTRPIGNFMSQLFLTIFYIVFVWPLGIIYALFSDPLKIRNLKRGSSFEKWEHPKQSIDEARKQY